MIIKVTDQHIQQGERESPERCPIALACIEAGLPSPQVDHEDVTLEGGKIPLPLIAMEFIMDFDDEEEVKPFEFDLGVV